MLADILAVLFIVIMTGLALLGGVVLALLLFGPPLETERQRIAREAREAERRITEIGRQAQAAILQEAFKRAQMRPKATRTDQPGGSGNAADQRWPRND